MPMVLKFQILGEATLNTKVEPVEAPEISDTQTIPQCVLSAAKTSKGPDCMKLPPDVFILSVKFVIS